MIQIFDSSQKMTLDRRKISKRDWPWNTINCGQSFAVNKNEIKFNTLRSLASTQGKKLNKKFRAIEHDDCFEVGRVE